MFIWIDLRRYLCGKNIGEMPNLSIHRLSPQEKAEYQRREMEIGRRCAENGVVLALGTNFFTEEIGWFRLGYTVAPKALEIGLERLVRTLKEIERVGWNSN